MVMEEQQRVQVTGPFPFDESATGVTGKTLGLCHCHIPRRQQRDVVRGGVRGADGVTGWR